jgi:hypothetical protein
MNKFRYIGYCHGNQTGGTKMGKNVKNKYRRRLNKIDRRNGKAACSN